ncbi:MAG: hypothetical protein KGL18_08390 [Burkholderiales bacterium]|nr:hypothetical protein [Burkholderiales bacterium]MDE1925899.1 hypothetical protein [Burkholderiales bacterium]MDE2502977.1 hypothetical protein [Burkholderiales bacterium]
MRIGARIAWACLLWFGAGAAAWWIHHPPALAGSATRSDLPRAASSAQASEPTPKELAAEISAVDPMGLVQATAAILAAPQTAASAAEAQPWQFAALVVRGKARYAVLASPGQVPLTLGVGERLPDGDKITSIEVDHADVVNRRGRKRTLYLLEP